ncbi:hypothetical protein RO3G_17059 [Rhizopus delemar RA 99-880]|uniref:T-cell immunomodulatory protein TIP C2 domain-containing protein n=1 Tax=Rhizopus delemar (strain RA 99-880 / ATCC MYA-4621 / FGSC 9543 / NRRL 43880) TaxID=246409 RepID=I1CUX2_RHIO9|nr:hypothetical protein RO3G_17059 [Rhizopus delemar RA 99-880]|eukprot:EIE92252.1 hypothetical protein RO3G_17059 [Rhizopus delemar RA 99-880]
MESLTKWIQPGYIITNVVPGDYNYDGHLDVLLMGQESPEKSSEIQMQIYLGNGNDTFESQPIKLPSAQGALPIVLDINGDMKTDILGYSKETNQLSTWMNMGDSSFNLTLADTMFDKQSIDQCTWANPHSNAFVDLDGDCLADGFKLSQQADLPTGAGPLSFADIDGDGSIDIVFPVCQSSGCSIHVVYNQQMGLCSKGKEENYSHFRGNLPVALHTGDYNMDGYPDLLVTTTQRVVLLQSVLCNQKLCTKEAIEAEKRSFSIVTTGADALENVSNPRQAAFFDIDEDGSLDILVLQSTSTSDASRIPNFIINNYFNDAFFLKGLVLNGVSSHRGYGVSYPGASLKFTVLDTSGVKRSHQISQLSQSAYLPLLTPYCLFGLGRTNNYVEEMFAGVTRHQEKNYYMHEGVIPNSQLVILPYQPEDVQDSSSWKVELYIKPGDYVPWVLGVLTTAALVLGIVVVVLRVMEKREDEMERQKTLHIINFDAL